MIPIRDSGILSDLDFRQIVDQPFATGDDVIKKKFENFAEFINWSFLNSF